MIICLIKEIQYIHVCVFVFFNDALDISVTFFNKNDALRIWFIQI